MSDRDEVPHIAAGLESIEAMNRAFARMRAWQRTPEGLRTRARFERERLAAARAEREQLATFRDIPADLEVRRYALDPHPTGELFDGVREVFGWQREQEEQRGGRVPALRVFAGPPGTGKTSALAWGCASWPQRALYRTADALALLKRQDAAWREVERVSLLVIDELGIEAYPDVLVELLLARWTHGVLTLCASNLSVEAFVERYLTHAGERLADRLRLQKARGLRTFTKATWASYRGVEGRL